MKSNIGALILAGFCTLVAFGCGGNASGASRTATQMNPPSSSTMPSNTSTAASVAATSGSTPDTASVASTASLISSASGSIAPTTTLTAEAANSTSQAGFAGTANGNVKPGNVSKVDIHTLLYPGATTKVFAHYMPWWNSAGHVSIGLGDEANPAVVNAQVADAISRGIDGFMIDWYGPQNTHHNTATMNVKAAAEASANFEFAIIEDSGALTGSADPTTKLLSDIQYMNDNYFSSPRYYRYNGRPVVGFFLNTSLAINWATVAAQAAGNPVLIFRNAGGFTSADSGGSFSWVNPTSNAADNGVADYLDNFYATGIAHPSLLTMGATYKGFNDSIASWTAHRVMNQQCGQTWLASFADVSKHYSASNQLPFLQLVTWNDYEEGSELESGIDNCVTVTAALSGQALTWSITGQENTLDHYVIYVSQDGQNLMPLAEAPAGDHSMDLSGYAFPGGTYKVYVKAIAKPGLLNQMSGAVTLTR